MPKNALITGSSGIGKTTIVQRIAKKLQSEGYKAGGLYCPEIRENGRRKGFRIVDLANRQSEILAHKDFEDGVKVGSYKVSIQNIEAVCHKSFPHAFREADYLMIDEIAPMELYSETFGTYLKQALDGEKPVLAVIHRKAGSGFIGRIKKRKDVRLFTVNEENRDRLVPELEAEMKSLLTIDSGYL